MLHAPHISIRAKAGAAQTNQHSMTSPCPSKDYVMRAARTSEHVTYPRPHQATVRTGDLQRPATLGEPNTNMALAQPPAKAASEHDLDIMATRDLWVPVGQPYVGR